MLAESLEVVKFLKSGEGVMMPSPFTETYHYTDLS